MGDPCDFTRASDESVVDTFAVLDKDVEMFDELGNVIDRADTVTLLNADVGRAKSSDKVEFTGGDFEGQVFFLGRTIKDDGYAITMMARRGPDA